MEHEGRALAADETDHAHHRSTGVASVHVRAIVTWCAIFPLMAIGMTVNGSTHSRLAAHPAGAGADGVVVPLSVYVLVPQLLRVRALLTRAVLRNGRRA